MPATEADLIAAIVADPDDRDARMIYADWLARSGDPRGELMHLELARAQMLEGDDNHDVIVQRIAQLAAELERSWQAPLHRLQISNVVYRTHLGVPACVAGTTEAIAAASVRLSANAPLVTRLEIAMQSSLRPLALTTLVRRATAIAIRAAVFEARCLHVLGDALPELRELSLRGALRAGALDWLVDASLPRLSRIGLTDGAFGRPGPRALEPLIRTAAPLDDLTISRGALGPELGRIVGAMAGRLRVVDLSSNGLGAAGAHALLPALGSIERLDLANNDLTPDVVRELLAALPNIRVLTLRTNPLGDAAAELIAEWPGASRLHTLDLGDTGITARGALALATSGRLANLRLLRIDAQSDTATRRALTRSRHLPLAKIYAPGPLDRSLSKSKRHRGA